MNACKSYVSYATGPIGIPVALGTGGRLMHTFLNKQRATNNKQQTTNRETEKQYERSAKGASYAIQNMYFSES